MTIYASLDWIYYDGLLCMARGCHTGDGDVWWCGELLPQVAETHNSAAAVPEERG